METPIYTRLTDYHRKGRISFAMPGHKNMKGLAPKLLQCDVTELTATVDLHHECDTVKRADKLLTELYKTRESFILTCGSTAGIQTMLSSVLKPGDTVLAASDCHMSVINTCAICGFKLRFVPVDLDGEFLIPRDIQDFEITPDVKAVIITSPNYYGIVKDIKALAEKCHSAGILLLVDEAHGAHFIGSPDFPESAVSQGADMVCQSAHKTLNALTGAAYLHVCGDAIDIKRVKRALIAFQTSSPSYPIAASADAARAELAEARYGNIIDECRQFREAIGRATKIRVLDNDDITRIVLCFAEYEATGFKVGEMLSQHFGIDVEMSDYLNIVLIVTPWNTHNEFMQLFGALRDICEMLEPREKRAEIMPPPVYTQPINQSEGWYAETETIAIDKAAGRISAAVITAYPPGTALIVTGAVITREQLDYIKTLKTAGAEITGLSGDGIEVVKWREL
ncbi:MAG: aminotransferase class I/II-fold pyridoxal phosphate-dependent enzyme [Candidatus Ornithomonoglobus sp.]